MSTEQSIEEQGRLVARIAEALAEGDLFPQIFETHLSWVIVTKSTAYKFKKAVKFDFVDCTSLESRRHFCHEEVRLNRRFSPDLYLGVCGVSGSAVAPFLGGIGEPIEYAVKMRAFEEKDIWDNRVKQRTLTLDEVDLLARRIVAIHRESAIASSGTDWGGPDTVRRTAAALLQTVSEGAKSNDERQWAGHAAEWNRRQLFGLEAVFSNRKASGHVRECHGDLHLGNIVTFESQPQAFDCLEFRSEMRRIDVMYDIAFFCMDAAFKGRPDCSSRFLNCYLADTGDYDGLRVLQYYQFLRALIRCKVMMLRACQPPALPSDANGYREQARRYLEYASVLTKENSLFLFITFGLSGTGKSTISRHVSDETGAIWLRSDVERRRTAEVAGRCEAPDSIHKLPRYSEGGIDAVYVRLKELSADLLRQGFPVVVDATFLKRSQRQMLKAVADEWSVPFRILHVFAEQPVIRNRVATRLEKKDDFSEADLDVIDSQLRRIEYPGEDEKAYVIDIDNNNQMCGTHNPVPHEILRKLSDIYTLQVSPYGNVLDPP